MATPLFTLALIALAGPLSRSCEPGSAVPFVAGPVVGYGDSLTAGWGADPSEAYPVRLQRGMGSPVLNMGISGETSAEAYVRLDAVIAARPSLVIVAFGANEALRSQPIATAIAGLDRILTDLDAAAIPVLLIGVHYVAYGTDFDDALRDLAAKHGDSVIVDALAGILDDPRFTGDGGYHPNAIGYGMMADRIRPSAQAILESACRA